MRAVSHGLRLGPYASGSVVGRIPSSGVFVLPDDDEASGAKALRQRRVDGSAEIRVLEQFHPQVKRLARVGGAEVLEQERDALERAVGKVRRSGLGAPLLELLVDDRVELRVERLDPADGLVDELRRRDLTLADELSLGGRVHRRGFHHR